MRTRLVQNSTAAARSRELSNTRRRALLLTLTITCSLGQIASVIYVPCIPAIAAGLETSVAWVQFTFVGYLTAFAVSMLALGPLSDRYGRRRVITLGLAVGVLGSIACAASPTIDVLIAARILQGIGFAAGMVVGRAVIRDNYSENSSAQIIAGLSIVITLLQAFAPIPGGYLQAWIGWRANFAFVGLGAIVSLALAVRYVSAGCAVDNSHSLTRSQLTRSMLASYRSLLQSRRFTAYALTATGAHAGFHIFAAGAPAVLMVGFAIPPQDYGYYAALPPMGFLLGSFLSNRLTQHFGVDNLIAIGSAVLIPAGAAMMVLAAFHFASPYAIVGPMILICCGSGLITPNAVAGSLGVKIGIVGAASGLASFIQMIGAAGATAALSLGPSGNPLVLAVVIAAAGLFAVSAFGSLVPFVRLSEKAGARAPV